VPAGPVGGGADLYPAYSHWYAHPGGGGGGGLRRESNMPEPAAEPPGADAAALFWRM